MTSLAKKLTLTIVLTLLLTSIVNVPSAQAYTAATWSDLVAIIESGTTNPFNAVINGKNITISYSGPGGIIADYYIESVHYGSTVQGDPSTNGAAYAFAQALGISITTAGSIASPNSPASVTTRVVFDNLVLPSAKTANEKKKEEAKRRNNSLRVLSSNVSTEWVKNKNEDGRVYGFNLGLAYDFDNFTVGAVVPYDHLDNNIYRGDRVGTVLFGQYHILSTDTARLSATINTNYLYSTTTLNGTSFNQSLNVFGTGASLGGSYNLGKVELGAGVTYQYNKDDSGLIDTDQHLVKLGSKVGLHITDNQVISALGYYTEDVTSYKLNYGKQNYFEVGGEYKLSLTDTWTLNLGYKKTLGLSNYRSDVATIGAVWMF